MNYTSWFETKDFCVFSVVTQGENLTNWQIIELAKLAWDAYEKTGNRAISARPA